MIESSEQFLYQVCIPHTGRDCYTYQSQDAFISDGFRVEVPFRHHTRIGFCISRTHEPIKFEAKKIISILDREPVLSAEQLMLAKWISGYYQSPLSEVLPLMLPKKLRDGEPEALPEINLYTLNIDMPEALSQLSNRASKQIALIKTLSMDGGWVSQQTLSSQGFSKKIVQDLIRKGLIKSQKKLKLPFESSASTSSPLTLNHEQQTAVRSIKKCFGTFQCFLLEGVTGSGKTEVYLQLIDAIINQNKQSLVLVPEIGLTPQLIKRFQSRFNEPMVVLHSALNETERHHAWQLAKNGIAKIIIGTRSAVFTPTLNLGIIIIDEEHDASFKQIEGVRYSARDTAIFRAQKRNIPIVLGSATPSLESLNNIKIKKFKSLKLSQKATASKPLTYEILDIRSKHLVHGLAQQTVKVIERHLEKKEQVMIFLNRRGFAPVLMCHECGWMVDCKACDSHMTYHQHIDKLICHHCGLVKRMISLCQSCKNGQLFPVGAGTQRVDQYLKDLFKDREVLRVDKDVTQKKHAMDTHLDQILDGSAEIIIGTQMLAKGHHFPNLTCVIILDTDNGFYNQDFRALERLGQLITQVAGRAGREEKPGHVLIQTHLPHHPLLNLLIERGYSTFAEQLLAERREAMLPPFQYIAVFRAQGKIQNQLLDFLHQIKKQHSTAMIQILGPAPAPLARKNNQYRMQLLIKSKSRKALNETLTSIRSWLTIKRLASGIRWNIDVDPIDLS